MEGTDARTRLLGLKVAQGQLLPTRASVTRPCKMGMVTTASRIVRIKLINTRKAFTRVSGATALGRLVLSSFQKEEKNPLRGSGCHVFLWGCFLHEDRQMRQVPSRAWGTPLEQVEGRWRLLSQECWRHHPQNIPDQAKQSLNKFSQEQARWQ